MRFMPVTMATQHPDNATPPYYLDKSFLSTADEIEECYRCFADLGIHEYMWDWEGKFVDEAVIDRLFMNYTDFFRAHPLGKEHFLTFRIPNIWEEHAYKLPRSLMNIIAAENAARELGFEAPPIFEIILPMTKDAKQLLYLQEKFQKIAHAAKDIFEMQAELDFLNIIPLFETQEAFFSISSILEDYRAGLQETYQRTPEYLRVFIARSDPSMNMGFIPAMLSCKVAVHECHTFARESGIPIYPWIGSGSLPFRGGVNPEHIAEVIEEYKGVYSVSIQTAFRSDYPLEQAKSAIATLHEELPKAWEAYTPLDLKTVSQLRTLILESTPFFRESIEALAETINGVAKHVPKHRERMQHIGLFGYSRGVGSVTLPRAITFTASLYSLGIPPELIGSGRILAHAAREGKLSLLEEFFPTLRAQLLRAGAFLNKENLSLLLAKDPAWKGIHEDVLAIEAYLGTPLAPRTTDELIHRNLTSTILHKYFSGEALTEDILAAARFRKSLG